MRHWWHYLWLTPRYLCDQVSSPKRALPNLPQLPSSVSPKPFMEWGRNINKWKWINSCFPSFLSSAFLPCKWKHHPLKESEDPVGGDDGYEWLWLPPHLCPGSSHSGAQSQLEVGPSVDALKESLHWPFPRSINLDNQVIPVQSNWDPLLSEDPGTGKAARGAVLPPRGLV